MKLAIELDPLTIKHVKEKTFELCKLVIESEKVNLLNFKISLDKIPYYRNRNNYIFYRLKDICYFDIMYYENINQEIINFALIKNPY